MRELKEESGMSPADTIYGRMLPGSAMEKAVAVLNNVPKAEGYEKILREELEKLGVAEHTGELLMRWKEANPDIGSELQLPALHQALAED